MAINTAIEIIYLNNKTNYHLSYLVVEEIEVKEIKLTKPRL